MYRDEVTLLDIWRAAHRIIHFTDQMDREVFFEDERTYLAVQHQIMVIGEAAKRLSHDFRQANPQIPWKFMAGMRNKLIHFYEGVELEIVWTTATKDIPGLISILKPLIPEDSVDQ